MTPRPLSTHDMTFDQVFGYPNSIQDVLHQIEKEEKKNDIDIHKSKKKPTSIVDKMKNMHRYQNVSKLTSYE